MALKQFPRDGEQEVSYEELVKPFRKILETAFEIKPKKVTKNIPYDGYGFTHRIAATSPQPPDRFTLEGIEYDAERDRDVLDVVINVIFQLGYEQGAFIQRKDWAYYKKSCDEWMEENKKLPPLSVATKKKIQQKLKAALKQSPKPKKKTKKKK